MIGSLKCNIIFDYLLFHTDFYLHVIAIILYNLQAVR